jgi:hypothetical protein
VCAAGRVFRARTASYAPGHRRVAPLDATSFAKVVDTRMIRFVPSSRPATLHAPSAFRVPHEPNGRPGATIRAAGQGA